MAQEQSLQPVPVRRRHLAKDRLDLCPRDARRQLAEAGKPFEVALADGMTIGRDSSCQVLLGDDYASGVHARIERTDAGWLFTDLGSTNGSWQGHRRIDAPLLVKPGMTIRIGKTTLRFEK